jgi:hypothetical protein
MAVSFGEALRPSADLIRQKGAHRNVPEGVLSLTKHEGQAGDRGPRGLVLLEVAVDELRNRPVLSGRGERSETRAIESGGERLARLRLRLEAADLSTTAVLVTESVRPQRPARFLIARGELVRLAALDARHRRLSRHGSE